MNIYKTVSRIKVAFLWATICLGLGTLIIFPTQCRNGATNAVFLCIQVLIPSLFPFMVLSGFMVSSGISSKIPKFFTKPVSVLYDLPRECTSVILLSLIGGYPVGASGIKALYCKKAISEMQAQRMAMFCVASGPGFLVTYLGTVMLSNTKVGYILLISQTISVLMLGLVARFVINNGSSEKEEAESHSPMSIGEALTEAVSTGIKSCVGMCSLVVLFGVLCEVFIFIFENGPKIKSLVALIEITNGTKILAEGYPVVIISFACGFGGLCVHFQIFQQLKGICIPKGKFYFFRIMQGFLCSSITYILTKIYPQSAETFSSIESARPTLSNSLTGCVMLMLSSVLFLISLKSKKHCR